MRKVLIMKMPPDCYAFVRSAGGWGGSPRLLDYEVHLLEDLKLLVFGASKPELEDGF